VTSGVVRGLARECGFELAGVARAEPLTEAGWYLEWVHQGMAGEMAYLTDHRASLRADPRSLLPSARSIICVGKLYNGSQPYSTEHRDPGCGWISRYAWGKDYHQQMRRALRELAGRLAAASDSSFAWKTAVDTSPLLERALARRAGLGWIGKNSCLINQASGSWFYLGELLVSLDIEPDTPPPDRCGSCTRCIDACPTGAILPTGRIEGPSHTVDSRRCVSYLTIEFRGEIPASLQPGVGRHVFGCDVCQDVCPWNHEAPVTGDPHYLAMHFAPRLETLQGLSEDEWRRIFGHTPVSRAGYKGFQRNVAVAVRNAAPSRSPERRG